MEMRRTLLGLTLAGLSLGALAAGEGVLPPIAVRASALSDMQTGDNLSGGDAAALFQSSPGYSLQSAGGASGLPVLRGLADERLKVRIDGAEITSACGNHMNSPLSYIAPAQVADASVMAGITPVSLGGDNIGGVIDVASAPPRFAEAGAGTLAYGKLSLQTRSVDNGSTARLDAAVAGEQWHLGYSGVSSEADSYEDGDGIKVPDTLYKSTHQTLTLAARGEGRRWVLRVGEQDIPYQGYPNQYMDMVKNHGVFANLAYSGDHSWGRLDGRLSWQDTRHKMGFFSAEKTGNMPMDTHGRDVGYSLKAGINLDSGATLRLGHEFHRFELDDWWPPVFIAGSMMQMMWPRTYVNINDGKRERIALYAEWEGRLGGTWSGLFGLRDESVRTDAGRVQDYGCGMMCMPDAMAAAAFNARGHVRRDNNVDATALFRNVPRAGLSYEFGYALKTRSPSLYERYSWGRGTMAMSMIGWYGDGNGYVGDIDLKPEVAHTLSATIDWHDAAGTGGYFRITPYVTRVIDFIDADAIGSFVRKGATRALLRFANHDVRLHGVNVSWQTRTWESPVWGNLRINGKFDWTRGKREDGGDLYHIMPPNLALALEQTSGAWTNGAELQVVGAKSKVDNRRFEDTTSGYQLVNVSTRYRLNANVTLLAAVRNLFDRQYALPLGGVNVAAPMAGSRFSPLYGQGRSLDLGVDIGF